MKIPATLLSLLLLTFHASAEMRTFTSSDGDRSFDGRLTAYNSETKTVTVVNMQRQTLHFDISLLSSEDQEYVTKTAPTLPVNLALDVRFEPVRERQEAERSGRVRRTTYDGGYTITLNNYSAEGAQAAEVEYLMIYRKDEVTGSGENKTISGRQTISIEPNGSHDVETEIVQLVNFYQRGQVRGGGCGGGGCSTPTATRSQRSRDYLVGCIVRVTVNGEVIETAATAPNILRTYEDQLGGGSSASDYRY